MVAALNQSSPAAPSQGTAAAHVEDVFALPRQLVGSRQTFALPASGNSMIKGHITDGENSEIVASRGVNPDFDTMGA